MILMINLFIIMLIMHALWGGRPHFLRQQLLEQLCNDLRHRGLIGTRVCVHRRACMCVCLVVIMIYSWLTLDLGPLRPLGRE